MNNDLKSIQRWSLWIYIGGVLLALPLFFGYQYPVPAQYYLWVKIFHVLGVIAFMGNICTGPLWLIFALRSKNVSFIALSMRALCWADVVFTIPGVLLTMITGLQMANTNWGGYYNVSWIAAALLLLAGSGFVGVPALGLQYKLFRMGFDAAEFNTGLPPEFAIIMNKWSWWGMIATILPLMSFVLMVLKPQLW